jgi:hypothetical protein
MDNYTQYVEYTRSGRKAIEHFLNENPYLSFAALRKKLHEKNICLKDQTIRNYISNWRVYSKNGRVPMHHGHRGFLESGFGVGLWDVALCYGWRVSRNRNRERWRCVDGVSFGWSRNGKVDVRFKGPLPRAYLLGAFSRAFWNVLRSSGKPEGESADYLKALFEGKFRLVERTITVETGQPLPKVTIDRKRSHGEIIKLGDGSHPTSVEIEETEPFWASELKEAAIHISKNLKSHVEVMRVTKEVVQELKSESLKRQEALKRITSPQQEQDSFFVDNWIWIVEKLDFPVKGWCGRCHERDRLLYYVEDRYGYSSVVCEDCGQLLKVLIDGGASP